jgi:glyoxylase-like metal-dependent hydrolase (beta-lactamase superfamily II)
MQADHRFYGRVLLLALSVLVAAAATAAPDPDLPFTLRQVAPGVYAAIDRETLSGANAGFVIGDHAVAVVDSLQFPEAAEKLVAEIRSLTPLPIRYLINTHHHIDHVGGNGVLKRAGAIAVAQRNVQAWIRTENLKFFDADKVKERARVESLPLPDVLVDQSLMIRLGARCLELRAFPGHAGSDLVVAVPDAKVLFCGDLVWRQTAPGLTDATVSKWIETLEALRRRPDAAAYTYVPGQGDVAKLSDITDFERYLEDLTQTVKSAMSSGAKDDELVAAALPALKTKYQTWTFFDQFAPKQILFMEWELSGTKRLPSPDTSHRTILD